jgi:hypothetical protein
MSRTVANIARIFSDIEDLEIATYKMSLAPVAIKVEPEEVSPIKKLRQSSFSEAVAKMATVPTSVAPKPIASMPQSDSSTDSFLPTVSHTARMCGTPPDPTPSADSIASSADSIASSADSLLTGPPHFVVSQGASKKFKIDHEY